MARLWFPWFCRFWTPAPKGLIGELELALEYLRHGRFEFWARAFQSLGSLVECLLELRYFFGNRRNRLLEGSEL
jgi:hypothetical protein